MRGEITQTQSNYRLVDKYKDYLEPTWRDLAFPATWENLAYNHAPPHTLPGIQTRMAYPSGFRPATVLGDTNLEEDPGPQGGNSGVLTAPHGSLQEKQVQTRLLGVRESAGRKCLQSQREPSRLQEARGQMESCHGPADARPRPSRCPGTAATLLAGTAGAGRAAGTAEMQEE